MALGEAKVKTKSEFKKVLKESGFTLTELKEYVDRHPEMKRPTYKIPSYKGITGKASRFIKHVSRKLQSEQPLHH
jgi:hypothetical protein